MHKHPVFLYFLILEIAANVNEQTAEIKERLATITEISDQRRETYRKCFSELGCISTDETWFHSRHRPINLKPLERRTIKTQFVLMRKNRTDKLKNEIFTQIVSSDRQSLDSAGFIPGIFLFLLIHDFTSNGYTGWIKHISQVLKTRTKKCNIISVDWHAGARPPYDQAIANARVVALEIVFMLKFLKEYHKLALDQVHIIGHGVGAHIAGYVGRLMELKKITGLDPSGPRFEGMPAHVRLHASHAKYVEVLHTDAMDDNHQGAMTLFGHADFFINNAEMQPGCPQNQAKYDLLSITRAMLKEGQIVQGCNHKRAFKYYIEALELEECTFLGIKCPNYADFREGKCTSCDKNCRTFGLVSYHEGYNSSYFLQTASKRPFCLFQYRVTVHINGPQSNYFGSFDFFLADKNHFMIKSATLQPREFKSGGDNSFVFYAETPDMSHIVHMKVGWKQKSNALCFIVNCRKSINVERLVMQNINNNAKSRQVTYLCPKQGLKEIRSGEYQDFGLCKTEN
ncbi:pancreatic lipase-related protein 2-like [Euwallacea similis]|uniref:pancreatic lipase-related protein 2-like n=1 Tax=Euwallacea similis TaxID=1736056 RepID=UPI00344CB371